MKVFKVRALVTDANGSIYMITGNEAHVLQIPGGTVKRGENLRKAVIREIQEETGFRKIRITGRTKAIKVRRNGVTEVTVCFRAVVSGKRRKPALTGRERARGLAVTRYSTAKKAVRALERRLAKYGRSAVRRDLRLLHAALAA